MAAIDKITLAGGWRAPELWPAVARHVQQWLDGRGAPARDAVLLLPFSGLLAPARQAFATLGGWQPRIETPLTLVASAAPPWPLGAGLLSGDLGLDRLNAGALLRRQSWGQDWARRDARGFEQAAHAVVDAAHTLARAAAARAPAEREDFWQQARELLPAPGGPGAAESLLLRVAVEWASVAAEPATDVLFTLHPSAWIALRLGGPDALTDAVLCAATVPALHIDADPPDDDPFRDAALAPVPSVQVCDSMEHEAQAAAATVIQSLNDGRWPVALVALDRVLVRRVRALLERAGVPLIDETGWKLSTTRAAARLMGLLKAASPASGRDARLGWLKDWPAALADPQALQTLEARWRESRRRPDESAAAAAEALDQRADAFLEPFRAQRERTLSGWLALLLVQLRLGGDLAVLSADPAGQQVLGALRLEGSDLAWQQAAAALRFDLNGFAGWVDATLEAAHFLPPSDPAAAVVLTPLARALGRPFAAVVVPGADQRHLGSIDPPAALIHDGLAQALGLDHTALRRHRQRLALGHLLRADAVTLLRRRFDGSEPLAPSPDVEWLALARARAGVEPMQFQDPVLPKRLVAVLAVPRPAPAAAAALPLSLSASTVEALRQCPYRFFARSVLRLGEDAELEAGLDKRDYGNWLHAVLHRFHLQRQGVPGDDVQLLHQAAEHTSEEQALDLAELLPYRASFDSFAPAYLRWLAAREASGWFWQGGEDDRVASPAELAPQRLQGRLDRLDGGPGGVLQLIDYKTGALQSLKQKVQEPLEDTQLAFYAALVTPNLPEGASLAAVYLALDDRQAPVEVVHEEVATTAAVLLQGLAGDLRRLRDGAGLRALGEGRVCNTCEARGLCRRDHWEAAE